MYSKTNEREYTETERKWNMEIAHWKKIYKLFKITWDLRRRSRKAKRWPISKLPLRHRKQGQRHLSLRQCNPPPASPPPEALMLSALWLLVSGNVISYLSSKELVCRFTLLHFALVDWIYIYADRKVSITWTGMWTRADGGWVKRRGIVYIEKLFRN